MNNDSGKPIQLLRNIPTIDWETAGQYVKFDSKTTWQASEYQLIETCKTFVHTRQSDVQILDIIVRLHALPNSIAFQGNIGLGYYAAEMEHRKTADSKDRIGESEVNGQESEWGTLCGIVGNTAVGIAILPHPANGKTLFIAEDVSIGYLLAQTQPFTLGPNKMLTLKYRVLIYVGDLFTIDLSESYQKYTSSDV